MRHDTEYLITANGRTLMSSRVRGSEEALAGLAFRDMPDRDAPCVLIGGLGMGFTLRATLDLLPATAAVVVAELLPAVIEWNRGVLGPLAAQPLDDRRVQVDAVDVGHLLRSSVGRFDVVLLDVDNGPSAFTDAANAALYGERGLAALRLALKPGGTAAIWSAADDARFAQRLRGAGFTVTVERVRARHAQRKRGGPRHTVYLGHLR